MKRLISLILILVFCISLTGCKSKAERELEQARDTAARMQEALEQAEEDYEDLLEDLDRYTDVSSGKKNALKSAENYLYVMPFSYEGLIDQLEYEGYSHEEAVYGADNCGADWYAQAAEKAESYLEIMAFSQTGLIEQLEYDGFTHDQAVYGVNKVY